MRHLISVHQCPRSTNVPASVHAQLLEFSAHPKYHAVPGGRRREYDPGLRMLFQALVVLPMFSPYSHPPK